MDLERGNRRRIRNRTTMLNTNIMAGRAFIADVSESTYPIFRAHLKIEKTLFWQVLILNLFRSIVDVSWGLNFTRLSWSFTTPLLVLVRDGAPVGLHLILYTSQLLKVCIIIHIMIRVLLYNYILYGVWFIAFVYCKVLMDRELVVK